MAGHGEKLARKQEQAIAALLVHRTVEEAANAVGVSAKTLFRWQQQPEFREAYRQARRDAYSQCTARLQHASSAAVSTLLKVLVDPNARDASKVRAADCVLSRASKAIELEEIEARLVELERSAKKKNAHNRN